VCYHRPLYGSSPQPTSRPLFAHRESPASLSSTKSFLPLSASGSGGCGALSKIREKRRNRGANDDEGAS
jgi:hypothetical protein